MVKTTWLGFIKSESAKNPGKSLGEVMKIASPKWKKMKKGGGDEEPTTPAVAETPAVAVAETPAVAVAETPAVAVDETPAVAGGRRKSKKRKGGKKRCKSKRKSCRRKK